MSDEDRLRSEGWSETGELKDYRAECWRHPNCPGAYNRVTALTILEGRLKA